MLKCEVLTYILHNSVHFAYTKVRCHDKNINSPEQPIMNTHILFNNMYADMMIHIIYRMRKFMTTYMLHTKMYLDMIKNIKSPENFNKMYRRYLLPFIFFVRQY